MTVVGNLPEPVLTAGLLQVKSMRTSPTLYLSTIYITTEPLLYSKGPLERRCMSLICEREYVYLVSA